MELLLVESKLDNINCKLLDKQMEYYAGYLMPVKLDSQTRIRPCKDSDKLKKRLKTQIGGLETRIKKIEGRLMTEGPQTKSRKRGEGNQVHSLNKRKYKIIENEYHDYNMKSENEKLRQQNRLLNEYFEIFSKKYRDNKAQLQALRQQNSRLNSLISKNNFESTSPNHSKLYQPRAPCKSQHRNRPDVLDKYVYSTPPYQEDVASTKGEGFLRSHRINIIKSSQIETKLATNYDDSYDLAKTSRSGLHPADSDLL